MKLLYKILYNEKYWLIKAKVKFYLFKLRKINFLVRARIIKIKNETQVGFFYWSKTISGILRTTLVVILLFVADNFLLSLNSYFPSWLQNIQTHISEKDIQGDIFTLLTVILSVAGLLLALFYPLLATVASTAYSKIRSDIRQVLIRERYSQFFVRQLAFLVAVVFIILFSTLFHNPVGLLTVLFVGLFTLRAIFSVIKTGLGIFNFFDPSNLMYTIIDELKSYTQRTTIKGIHWEDENFQASYQKNANNLLEQADIIVGLCAKEEYLQDTSFENTIKQLTYYLRYYLDIKSSIPTTSRWYPYKAKYKSLFNVNMSKREIAQRTNSFIQPDFLPNQYWIEERIISSFSKVIENFTEKKLDEPVLISLRYLIVIAKDLGRRADLYSANLLLSKSKAIIQKLEINQIDIKQEAQDELLTKFSIVESYLLIIEEIYLGFFNRVDELKKEEFCKMILNINWEKDQAVYELKLIDGLTSFFERIRKDVLYEKKIEGKYITPDWALIQFLSMQYIFLIQNALEELSLFPQSHIISTIRSFEKNNQTLLSTFIALRSRHTIWKISGNLERIKSVTEQFNDLQKQKQTRWAKIDFNMLQNKLIKYEKFLKGIIFKNINSLTSIKWNENLPDLFAESYSVLCEEINDALFTNDIETLKKYFKEFIHAAINASVLIRYYSMEQKYEDYYINRLSNQTIMDLLDLGGLFLIYSIINDNYGIWEICVETWDKYLEDNFKDEESEKKFIESLLANYGYWQTNLHTVQEGFERAHHRKLSLNQKLKDLGYINEDYSFYRTFLPNELKKEKDILKRIIKEYFSSDHFYINFADFFIELYLRCRISSKEVNNNLYKRRLYKEFNL